MITSFEVLPGFVPADQELTEIGYLAQDADGKTWSIVSLFGGTKTSVGENAVRIFDNGDGIFGVESIEGGNSSFQFFSQDTEGGLTQVDTPEVITSGNTSQLALDEPLSSGGGIFNLSCLAFILVFLLVRPFTREINS